MAKRFSTRLSDAEEMCAHVGFNPHSLPTLMRSGRHRIITMIHTHEHDRIANHEEDDRESRIPRIFEISTIGVGMKNNILVQRMWIMVDLKTSRYVAFAVKNAFT